MNVESCYELHRPNSRFMDFMENESDQDDVAPKKMRLAPVPIIDFPGNH